MPASKAQQAAVAERRKKAIALKLAGLDPQAIADQLGYPDRHTVCQDIRRALEANIVEQKASREQLREMELMRLDRLQAAAWATAVKGDLKAIETALKIVDRRAKLLGLDAPQKLEVLTIDAIDAAIADLNQQLAATDAEAEPPAGAEGTPG